VVDRDGKVAARFDADKAYVRSKQVEPELVKKVEELLAVKPKPDSDKKAPDPKEPKKEGTK
jgi:hypothetical protein